ncbi:MAG: RNA polymerase sigma factor [Acidobacteria bacterium]|nr:RNA polymerase sigma factor [Acidobacteriota bacterium]
MGLRTLEVDQSLWHQAYEQHGPSILAFLTSRIGRDLAEELLQETFVRAMRRGPQVASTESLRSYLFTTAHHLVINDRRRNRVRLFSELTGAEESSITGSPAGAAHSPELAFDLGRIREGLDAALGKLSPTHREAFQAAVMEQKPYAIIAREQEWTMEKVKINVHRARKKVIAMLSDLARPKEEGGS